MKIGLFGGSFNPPHRGHVEPVQAARRLLGLERVIYLVTADPPHKNHLAPAYARYAMLEMALLAEPGLYASTHELTPGRTAYTIDTVTHFERQLPAADLHLIIGSDSLAALPTWRRWRDLVAAVRLVVLERPGWSRERLAAEAPAEVRQLLADGRAHVLDQPLDEASSTAVRQLLARGLTPPPGILSPMVLDYARKYSLYR